MEWLPYVPLWFWIWVLILYSLAAFNGFYLYRLGQMEAVPAWEWDWTNEAYVLVQALCWPLVAVISVIIVVERRAKGRGAF